MVVGCRLTELGVGKSALTIQFIQSHVRLIPLFLLLLRHY